MAGVQNVVACAAEHLVIAIPCVDDVVARAALDRVTGIAGLDCVASGAAHHGCDGFAHQRAFDTVERGRCAIQRVGASRHIDGQIVCCCQIKFGSITPAAAQQVRQGPAVA